MFGPAIVILLGMGLHPEAAATTTVFVNFEEQHLVAGDADDAPNGVSWTLSWFGVDEVTMPALVAGPGQDRDQLMAATLQLVRAQWETIDTEFVTTRPERGDFILVTMGGSGGLINLGGAGGWGILDCYDDNKAGVAFVFSDALRDREDDLSPTVLAQVISQEVAHTVGLEHLGESEDLIMFPSTTSAAAHVFGDTCLEITGAITDPEHPEYCLDHPGCPVGFQNDLAHLMEYWGPSGADPDPTTGTGTGGGFSTSSGSSGGEDSTGTGPGPSPDTDTDSDTEGESGPGDTASADGMDEMDEVDAGCGCQTPNRDLPPSVAIGGLFGLARIRTRRRAGRRLSPAVSPDR